MQCAPTSAFGPAAPTLLALRGIRLFDGDAGAGGGTPPATPPAAPAAPVPTPPAPSAVTPPPTPQTGAEDVASLPEWAQRVIREARKDAGDYRVQKNTTEQQLQAFKDAAAVTLGLKPAEQQEPAALAAALKAAQEQARTNAVRLAVFQHAATHAADPNRLLDSNAFAAATAALDPSAGDFAAQMQTAIKTAVEGNPYLKTVRATGASSPDLPPGGAGEAGPITEEQLRSASAEQVVEWHTKGRLDHLL